MYNVQQRWMKKNFEHLPAYRTKSGTSTSNPLAIIPHYLPTVNPTPLLSKPHKLIPMMAYAIAQPHRRQLKGLIPMAPYWQILRATKTVNVAEPELKVLRVAGWICWEQL